MCYRTYKVIIDWIPACAGMTHKKWARGVAVGKVRLRRKTAQRDNGGGMGKNKSKCKIKIKTKK